MRYFLLIISIFFSSLTFAQSLSDRIVQASSEKQPVQSSKRTLLAFKKRSARYNPLSYVGAGLLFMYQNIISDQFQAECSYEISCSEYTKRCIAYYGFFTGMLRGFNQLSECLEGARYEHPRLFINGSSNQIINSVADETR